MDKLLTRDEFRESVLNRDGHSCIMCKNTEGITVHHIFERKLFEDGGYYLNNGATLCSDCHWRAEMTLLSLEEIWGKIGIQEIDIPRPISCSKSGQIYDKWGNLIFEDGHRSPGPLFDEENVQKVLNKAGLISRTVYYGKD